MQQWYDLSDPAMEDALIKVPTMRRFAGIDLISERIPDETTILSFRHLLGKHDVGKQIFETVKGHLKANGMAMKQGTIIDANLIRSLELHPYRGRRPSVAEPLEQKGGREIPRCTKPVRASSGSTAAQGFAYDMKVHIGVDAASSLIHSLQTPQPTCMTSPQHLSCCSQMLRWLQMPDPRKRLSQ